MRLGVGLRLGRIGMHDQVQAALEVVEHRHFLAEQQQEASGVPSWSGLSATGQARLDVADGFEAEIADQAAGEGRQAGHARHPVAVAQRDPLRRADRRASRDSTSLAVLARSSS